MVLFDYSYTETTLAWNATLQQQLVADAKQITFRNSGLHPTEPISSDSPSRGNPHYSFPAIIYLHYPQFPDGYSTYWYLTVNPVDLLKELIGVVGD